MAPSVRIRVTWRRVVVRDRAQGAFWELARGQSSARWYFLGEHVNICPGMVHGSAALCSRGCHHHRDTALKI